MPLEQKSDPRQSNWEVASWLTLEDGTAVMVERAISYTSEGHRFTVLCDPGNTPEKKRAFLNTLYRTFCDTAGQRT